jgi:Ca2+-binding RTX toxin-like protein
MATVTVPGTSGGTLTYTYSAGAGQTVAQQIANALAAAGSSLTVTGSAGGGTVTASAGSPQELVLTGTGPTTVTGYGFIADNMAGAATITASAGTAILGSTGGGVFTETGTGNVLIDLGNSTVASTINAAGTGGTIVGGTATDAINVSGSGEAIYSNGSDVVSVTGSNDTIYGSANPMTISAGTVLVAGSGTISYLSTSTGVTTVQGGSTSSSINAPSGGMVYDASSAVVSTTINAGSASVTIFGAASGQSFYIGGSTGHNFVVAGSGSETLNAAASSANNWESANTSVSSGSYSFIGGTGNDTLIAGSAAGSYTLTGGGGNDAFVFFKQAAGGAKDVVTDFNSNDGVYIEGYASSSAANLLGAASVGAGGVTLTLSDNTTITFSNLTSTSSLTGKIQYG